MFSTSYLHFHLLYTNLILLVKPLLFLKCLISLTLYSTTSWFYIWFLTFIIRNFLPECFIHDLGTQFSHLNVSFAMHCNIQWHFLSLSQYSTLKIWETCLANNYMTLILDHLHFLHTEWSKSYKSLCNVQLSTNQGLIF